MSQITNSKKKKNEVNWKYIYYYVKQILSMKMIVFAIEMKNGKCLSGNSIQSPTKWCGRRKLESDIYARNMRQNKMNKCAPEIATWNQKMKIAKINT